ncbi:MAG: MBL fold metallo-hydrolase [Pseudomonadota bacterium]|nr:MBL fold metallo-hydrolase [Pseudomonadota bacterium]
MNADIVCFFDEKTNSASYVAADPETRRAAIIDPVLDFDPISACTSSESAERILDHVAAKNLSVDWILETHVHADHLTASNWLKMRLGSKTGVGSGIREVRATFGEVFNALDIIDTEASPYDKLFDDGEKFKVGDIDARVIATPGHTPSCVTYIIGNACFIGDTMFMPDSGTARCDFPGGDAKQLFGSLKKIFSLPDEMRLFVCHDYGAGGVRDFAWETTVGEQRRSNIHISGGVKEDDYVQMRSDRDATLSLPRLIIPAVQVNMRAGHFPPVEENGTSYIKVPLNVFQTRD